MPYSRTSAMVDADPKAAPAVAALAAIFWQVEGPAIAGWESAIKTSDAAAYTDFMPIPFSMMLIIWGGAGSPFKTIIREGSPLLCVFHAHVAIDSTALGHPREMICEAI